MFIITFLKNVEGSFLMKKFIAVLLCALFVVGLTQIPVCASDGSAEPLPASLELQVEKTETAA